MVLGTGMAPSAQTVLALHMEPFQQSHVALVTRYQRQAEGGTAPTDECNPILKADHCRSFPLPELGQSVHSSDNAKEAGPLLQYSRSLLRCGRLKADL